MTLPIYQTLDADLEAVKKQAEKAREIGLVAEDLLCSCNGFVKMCVWAVNHKTLEESKEIVSKWKEIEQTLAILTSFKQGEQHENFKR